jgi:penicillin-binding protein 1C
MERWPRQRKFRWGAGTCLLLILAAGGWQFRAATCRDLLPLPDDLSPRSQAVARPQYLDREGIPLSQTYGNPLNVSDWLPLHEIPELLQQAFVAAEDRRFFRHRGGDWLARAHAVLQNVRSLRVVRGASTISEQVVRIVHPRPRTLWARWLEGVEAGMLERRFSKAEILEFYLNQVPYGRQRRGVLQASRLYWNRDLDTLTAAEMLVLAATVRAPGRLEAAGNEDELQRAVRRLSRTLAAAGHLPESAVDSLAGAVVRMPEQHLPVDASHFLRRLSRLDGGSPAVVKNGRVRTTLDAGLQGEVQQILDSSLAVVRDRQPLDGAVLVVNHETDEILAWVNGGGMSGSLPGSWIDAVLTPRQPGSTLKPFLYSMALEMGWTASTIIDDSPLARPVGSGIHPFRNYSRRYYGPLRLREALGNSLNIPAIRTIQAVGVEAFLARLHALGFASLDRTAKHYGEGLALGNGEVTLFELVQAYAVLARMGLARPLRFTLDGAGSSGSPAGRICSPETASLIADILSDPAARRLEFGAGNILRMPVQTAVKTGTSNDHRDAWAVGYNHRYAVGVWMGNLDRSPTGGVTGTTGPGMVLRSVFSRLTRFEQTAPLYLSPGLVTVPICRESGQRAGAGCPVILERYLPGKGPESSCTVHGSPALAAAYDDSGKDAGFRLVRPTLNLQMAMDPRIPDDIEAYPLRVAGAGKVERIEWLVDGRVVGESGREERHFMWPLARGEHLVQARIWAGGTLRGHETEAVRFAVR